MTPAKGKRLMNISGVRDKLVPYEGGPSRVIPAKDGKLAFVAAEESTFVWARHMGYEGKRLVEPTRVDGAVEVFSYLDGDVVHCKVNNALWIVELCPCDQSIFSESRCVMPVGWSGLGFFFPTHNGSAGSRFGTR